MSDKQLVSCIIIFFNAEKFLEEAIESVFAQTYENWELLLIDDGSTDSSTTIALNYAEKYPEKVKYLEHEGHQNRGMSATRNLGIQNAKGDYIAFLDADDIWLPYKLEQQIPILSSHAQAGMLYGSSYYWYSWTGEPNDIQKDRVVENEDAPNIRMIQPIEFLTLFINNHILKPPTSSLLARRNLVSRIGGFEETALNIIEDQVFIAKMSLEAPVVIVKGIFERYRQHLDSCTFIAENITGEDFKARQTYLNWLEEYLNKLQVKEAKLWKALRKKQLLHRHAIFKHIRFYFKRLSVPMNKWVGKIARWILPAPIHGWLGLRLYGQEYSPPPGKVRLGSLRRVTPISRKWGLDRGQPIDRYYIEGYLSDHSDDIKNHVLEIGDRNYTRRFGGDRVTISDVLDVAEGNPNATLIADLTCAEHIPSDTFDCVILTQTLQYIFDSRSAIKTVFRILKPGGVALVTVPGISKRSGAHSVKNSSYFWHWSFTIMSAKRLFEEIFPDNNVWVDAYGNVLTAMAFLVGLATEELRREELDHYDPAYPVTIAVRAVKSELDG
jgi:glycosyltransferase involved in cell wall biosynthesis/SAM-dependent methyltransferase